MTTWALQRHMAGHVLVAGSSVEGLDRVVGPGTMVPPGTSQTPPATPAQTGSRDGSATCKARLCRPTDSHYFPLYCTISTTYTTLHYRSMFMMLNSGKIQKSRRLTCQFKKVVNWKGLNRAAGKPGTPRHQEWHKHSTEV